MLELTPTQSKIVEALKTGPKTSYELEQEIDRAKDFSTDYVKVMIHKINKKRKIIDSFYRDGQRCWRLIESEENVEYQILAGVNELLEDAMDMREHLAQVGEDARESRRSSEYTHAKVDTVDAKVDNMHADVKEVPYRANEGLYLRTNWVIVGLLAIAGIVLFMAGYFLGTNYSELHIEITPEVARMLK
jgi:hypothetical protein